MDFMYQGKIISITPNIISNEQEVTFQINNSMIVVKDPASYGQIAVNRSLGMQFSQMEGYQPDLSRTDIVKTVLSNPTYREHLLDYILRFVTIDSKQQIYITIGNDRFDTDVVKSLASLPRKPIRSDERINSRLHLVMNILQKVAHVPIVSYLDIGTGDGTIAAAIGKQLGIDDVKATDVFPLQRPIDTIVMKQGDRLPEEWNGKFQLVTAFSVLHHVKSQRQMLQDIHRVLAPGGIFIMREHDYLDNQFKWNSQLQPQLLTVTERPFRQFLDSIHIVSMAFTDEPAFWALYRARREWDTMILDMDMLHMYSNMRDVGTNPQRIYESVYMKRGVDISDMILEWKDTRSQRLDSFFPRLRGQDILDKIKEGINYNEEILAYMTPWRKAIETSQLISKTIKNLFPNQGRFKLVDGTGGAGGNDIAFSQNRDISILTIYERVPLFYNFIVNNLQLYTGQKAQPAKSGKGLYIYNNGQQIYINNSTPDLLRHRKDYYNNTVIFLDVPWEYEGSGYKLSGYKYEGFTLEELSQKLLQMKALLVVYKLPPDYQLSVQNVAYPIGKETIYMISQGIIQESVISSNLSQEILRFQLMDYLKQQFLSLFPEKKTSAYYRWIYEQLGYSDVRDPIIPATIQYRPSPFLESGVEVPFGRVELIKLVKEKYPDLLPQTKFPPGNKEALQNLISLVTERSRQQNPSNKQLFDLVNKLKNEFDSVSETPGMGATVSILQGVLQINANTILQDVLGRISGNTQFPINLQISPQKIESLRQKYRGSSFENDLATLLLRYSDVMDDRNANLHAAIPSTVFAMLSQSSLAVEIEGFASPLNATLKDYYSAFPDTDKVFGSYGNFLKDKIVEGSYEVNPPFTEEVMDSMVSRIETLMQDGSYSFVIVLPNWVAAPSIENLKASRYLKWSTVLPAGSHQYVVSDQHKQFKQISFNIETAIFILQSEKGSKDYPVPIDIRNKLLTSFV